MIDELLPLLAAVLGMLVVFTAAFLVLTLDAFVRQACRRRRARPQTLPRAQKLFSNKRRD